MREVERLMAIKGSITNHQVQPFTRLLLKMRLNKTVLCLLRNAPARDMFQILASVVHSTDVSPPRPSSTARNQRQASESGSGPPSSKGQRNSQLRASDPWPAL